MKIIPLNSETPKARVAAAIGFFDGVHTAHRSLIERMKKEAKKRGIASAVITFDKHPKSVLSGEPFHYITPLARKLRKIEEYDVDFIYLIRFNREKAALDPKAFIERYLRNVEVLVCGFDFSFGRDAKGTPETLKTYGDFETVVLKRQDHEGDKVGSTVIREAIAAGDMEKARVLLGEYYTIEGTVIHGAKKGRTIGYPTANIDTHEYLVPKAGVYASRTKVNGTWHDSVSSIGYNPTLNKNVSLSVESHIFDFDEELYGSAITVVFIKRIREERTFSSKEALIEQIDKDVVAARTILGRYKLNQPL
ncbi:MAG: bifunctional riboflavin kinase/FAD synthetase [Bacillota bacterium]